ncbi:RadC family protein [Methylomonas sp. ZR1]|uniref:JAB domain-containing protein n=1 Tax=Methylomonas sp. ZR1 TaxID=1797072 RepID=UPI0020A262C5|nr:DNA repair protein RadC [Methylomonas sp. ZR1]
MTADQQATINSAVEILSGLYKKQDLFATSPESVKQFCRLQAAHLEHEVFGVLLLDNQHQLIESITLFRGTIDGASVYPREVVKEVLSVNAAACIFFHNHPSSLAEPSDADRRITTRLIDALKLIDVRVLDHLIVTCRSAYSFAEAGIL